MPVSLFRNSSISVAFAVAFAALIYMGPAVATWVQVGAGLVLCVTPYVKPPQKMLFNLTSLPLETARWMGATVDPGRAWLVAPDFTYAVAPSPARALRDARGARHVLLVLYTLPASRPLAGSHAVTVPSRTPVENSVRPSGA